MRDLMIIAEDAEESLYEKGEVAFFKEEDIYIPSYTVLDADTYGVKEAYYKPRETDEDRRDEYVFVWDDAFAKVEFDGVPSEQQVKLVAEKLGQVESCN